MKRLSPNAIVLKETDSPVETVAMSAKLTHSEDIDFDIGADEAIRMVEKMIEMGHESTLEHASYTFLITCSRACSHQLVRHRVGFSYSQRSERYVEADELGVIIPPDILEHKFLTENYLEHFRKSKEIYDGLRAKGINKEDARFVLPRIATKIMVTANVRAWRNFLKLRLDQSAQWEIRMIANQIKDTLPEIFVNDL